MADFEDHYQIVRDNFFNIIEAVAESGARTVELIASDLLSRELITIADEQAALNPGGLGPSQIVSRFMVPVLNKIKHCPEAYEHLLQVFRDNELNYIAAKLEEEETDKGHSADEHLERKTRHNESVRHKAPINDDRPYPAPITALDVVYGSETPPQRGFHKIPVNLNAGCSKGTHVYICYSTSKHGPPITNIQVFAGRRKDFVIQDGYRKIPKDLNQGAGGKYVYLCYTTCTAFPPVTAVNVIQDDTVHVYPATAEWTRVGQNCSEGTHCTEHTYVVFKY